MPATLVFYTKMLPFPPLVFVLVSTLTGLRLQRHSVAQDAQLRAVMGAVGRGDIGGSMGGRSLCAIECL
jgi:hypothetical protein